MTMPLNADVLDLDFAHDILALALALDYVFAIMLVFPVCAPIIYALMFPEPTQHPKTSCPVCSRNYVHWAAIEDACEGGEGQDRVAAAAGSACANDGGACLA